jgi:hypothetical protein
MHALALILPAVVAVVLYAPSLAGGFIGDDFTLLLPFHTAREAGELVPTIARMFVSGVGPPSHQYRPLTMLSFALSEMVNGTNAAGWRAVNVALHAVNSALLALLVMRMLHRENPRAWVAALAAGTIYAAFPPSVEAVAWIAARFDGMVTFWMLVSACAFQSSRRWIDRYGLISLVAAALAFMSKEAAAILPLLILMLAWSRQPEALPVAVGRALRIAAPWLALTAAYFLLRLGIFGDAFSVLPGSSPLRTLVSGKWLDSLQSFGVWWPQVLPEPALRRALVVMFGVLALLAIVAAARERALSRALIALAITAIGGSFMLLLQLTWPPNGEGGRALYQVSAFAAAGIALPLASKLPRLRALACIAAGVALVVELPLAHTAIVRRVDAGRALDALRGVLSRIAASVPPGGYAFVVVPDHVGAIPFGRNAQAGLLLPPLQAESLAPRLIVQTAIELDRWPDLFTRDIIGRLRREPLLDVVANPLTTKMPPPHALPDRYYCFSPATRMLIPLALDFAPGLSDWSARWRSALAMNGCSDEPVVAPESGARVS